MFLGEREARGSERRSARRLFSVLKPMICFDFVTISPAAASRSMCDMSETCCGPTSAASPRYIDVEHDALPDSARPLPLLNNVFRQRVPEGSKCSPARYSSRSAGLIATLKRRVKTDNDAKAAGAPKLQSLGCSGHLTPRAGAPQSFTRLGVAI